MKKHEKCKGLSVPVLKRATLGGHYALVLFIVLSLAFNFKTFGRFSDASHSFLTSFIQQKSVSGRVSSPSGEPLPGVSILIKGSLEGTVTDANGNFSLTGISSGSVLVISFIGMETQEVPVGERAFLEVVMREQNIGIEEVVAIAYGTQKKRDVTGSISTLGTADFKDIPVNNVTSKLQGKIPGLQVFNSTGTPGRELSFRIRGQVSINAGNQPLVVVDGFPTLSGLVTINPEDIESVTVLKDAAASSLYGSRAANGVILITTKGAKEGRTDIQFSAYYGMQEVPERGRPDLMNAREFAQFAKEYLEDRALYEGYKGGVPSYWANPEQYGPNDGTNWYDLLLRDAPTQNYNFSLSSGGKQVKSTLSLNYFTQDGVMLNTYSNGLSFRSNNEYTVSEHLKFGGNISASMRNSQNFSTDGYWQVINGAFLMAPTYKYKNDDGTYPISFSSQEMFPNPNWYLVLKDKENPMSQTSAVGDFFAELKVIKGLTYKLKAAGENGNARNRSWAPSYTQGGMQLAPPQPASGTYVTNRYLTGQVENTLTYIKNFNDTHNLDILLGHSLQKTINEFSSITGSEYPDDNIGWINAASTRIGTAGTSQWSILSYIGRLNYHFKNKYLLSAAVRYDGSSKFGNNKKWGTFPSVSLGWVATEEDFLKSLDFISFLKLRGSYGKVGNNNIGDFTYLSTIVTSNYVFGNTLAAGKQLSGIQNNDLTWETTEQYNAGMDIGFLKDRIFFQYDYYWKKTDGLLYSIEIPQQSGYSNISANIGEFNFWGHEFNLETKNLTGRLKWNTNLNLYTNRNIVKKLGRNDRPIGGYQENADYTRTEVGHPIGQFYGYIHDGVFMTQAEFEAGVKSPRSTIGSVRIRDVGGINGVPDGKIDTYDKTFIGDPNPDFYFGITNDLTYKNFDFTMVVAGSYGGQIMDAQRQFTTNLRLRFNVMKEVANRWRSPENPGDGKIPRSGALEDPLHRYNNSSWVFDGSYLTAKNVTLGYTVPVNRFFIKQFRAYVSIQNAFTLTNYPGANPEVSDSGLSGLREGVDMSAYPIPRIYSCGININL
jgi:TonB-dependent starch-binding outer membrane protein SusC